MGREVFVAIFETRASAEQAKRDVEAAGIPSADISIRSDEAQPGTAIGERPQGFLDWLFGSGSEADKGYYTEHLARGRAILSITADSAEYGRISQILHGHDLVKTDERTTMAPAGSIGAAEGETVIPTAKEKLEVGKQQTADTRAYRIRRYVVEHPVEQQVSLHDETVTVERRQPTRARAGERPFEEKYVEVTETREEPVVRKVVTPGEEVAIRKAAQDRTETVRDTVRESKVEVDKAAAADKPSGRR
jgi:stress response protein YsnF